MRSWHTWSGKARGSKGKRWTQGWCPPCGYGGLQFSQSTLAWWVRVTEAQSFRATALGRFQQRRSHPQVESCLLSHRAWGSGKPGSCHSHKWRAFKQVVWKCCCFWEATLPLLVELTRTARGSRTCQCGGPGLSVSRQCLLSTDPRWNTTSFHK